MEWNIVVEWWRCEAVKLVKERQDVSGSSYLKDASDKVIVDENGIKDMEKIYRKCDKENEWHYEVFSSVKEGSAD